jgi:hypothetical protein
VYDTEFYAYADFRRWAVTGAWLRVVVWRAVGGDGEVLGQVAGWDLYGYIGVFFTVGLLYRNVEIWVARRRHRREV